MTIVEKTMGNYISPIVKNNFIVGIPEKQWMYLSEDGLTYIPLEKEHLDFMYENFEKNSDEALKKKRLDLLGDIIEGNINKEEGLEKILEIEKEPFFSLMVEVKAKFGFWPVRVGETRFKQEEFIFEEED